MEHLGSSVELLGSSLGALGSDFGALGDDFGSILGRLLIPFSVPVARAVEASIQLCFGRSWDVLVYIVREVLKMAGIAADS